MLKAVILAGGRGSRLGELTNQTPKPLVRVNGKSLIYYVLEALPEAIDGLVIVTGYLGEQIEATLGKSYVDREIIYVNQNGVGTGSALLSAREELKAEDRFMVVGSDDIFGAGQLSKLLAIKSVYGMGVFYKVTDDPNVWDLEFDHRFILQGRRLLAPSTKVKCIGTGSYILDNDFLNNAFAFTPSGEVSIPHTLILEDGVEVVVMDEWMQINNVEDKINAELFLKSQTGR